MMTQEMLERKNALNKDWVDAGDGYYRLQGTFYAPIMYIAIPVDHPLVKITEEDGIAINVNGGVTFKEGNVIGWDYGHFENMYDFDGDFERALEYCKTYMELKNT